MVADVRSLVIYNGSGSGLGNRIRTSLGGKNLAEASGRRFFVVWPTTAAFEPRFDQLYKGRLGLPMARPVSRALAVRYPYRDENVRDIQASADALVWQVRTGGVLELPPGVRSWEEDLRQLQPVDEVAARVLEVFGWFGEEPYVGVQVRTHAVSHAKTTAASPEEWYVSRLDEVRAANPDVRFFLSCDVPAVQSRLMARYPGSLSLQDKGGYNTVRGVQSALADLYLLASSAYIIGPAYSSFVETAVRMAAHLVPYENSIKERADIRLEHLTHAPDPLRPDWRQPIRDRGR